jgi:hypothetical protein
LNTSKFRTPNPLLEIGAHTLGQLLANLVNFEFFTNTTPLKIPLQLLYAIGNTNQ